MANFHKYADHLWHYRARALRVIDGDTVEMIVDLGFGISRRERVRVLHVDTPELRSSDPVERLRAQEARAFTEAWLHLSAQSDEEWPLMIHTSKGDSFGRWLAEITYGTRVLSEVRLTNTQPVCSKCWNWWAVKYKLQSGRLAPKGILNYDVDLVANI